MGYARVLSMRFLVMVAVSNALRHERGMFVIASWERSWNGVRNITSTPTNYPDISTNSKQVAKLGSRARLEVDHAGDGHDRGSGKHQSNYSGCVGLERGIEFTFFFSVDG